MLNESLYLPPIYTRCGKACYLDPIRKKLIYITPEETVRQQILQYLIKEIRVPKEMISVEQHLSHYGINTKRRADIVIHAVTENGDISPLAIIECKAPDVYLDDAVYKQMVDYAELIGAKYVMANNGSEKMCFYYSDNEQRYIQIEDLPDYEKMVEDDYQVWDIGELPPRIPFDKLESFLQQRFNSLEEDEYGYDISKMTPLNMAVAAFNLLECLLDTRIKLQTGDYGLFRLIEDYGVRMLSYGNASGGTFFGPYRSFLVEVNGNIEFYSLSVTTYWKSYSPDKVKTCIVVAHDDEKETHHALQLVVEDNIQMCGDRVDFYHHGKIAIGNMGSGKVDILRKFVNEGYPQIIKGSKFFLGSLVNDKLWTLQDKPVVDLIVNLISYSMIRDEYRKFVKATRK